MTTFIFIWCFLQSVCSSKPSGLPKDVVGRPFYCYSICMLYLLKMLNGDSFSVLHVNLQRELEIALS